MVQALNSLGYVNLELKGKECSAGKGKKEVEKSEVGG